MNCRELTEFLMAYLARDLPPAEVVRFEQHLAACPACVAYLKTYEQTVRLGKASYADPQAPVSGEVPEDLIRAILEARKDDRKR